jgi:hypothetical protein
MIYQIASKSARIEKDLHKVLELLTDAQREKFEQVLAIDPKGTSATHWSIKKVAKNIWQLDLPRGYRSAYSVIDFPSTVVIVFAGNHDDAAVFLREKK